MTENAKPNLSSEGHRHRVRERFLRGGGRDMADYELLEAYLMIAIPRRDVKPIAKALIAKFGSFADVINAPQSELLEVDGIGENSVFALKMVSAAAVRMSWEQLKGADLAGREITLSFDAKAEKLSGNVSFAIREIDAAGKSLRYQTVKLTKYDQHDWKNYTKTFKLSPKTDAIALHVTADYLDGEDSFRFANLKLTMQPAGK